MEQELTVKDLASVHTAVYKARAKWYNVGLQLGLEASTLDSIQSQFSGQPDSLGDCLRETLKRWLQSGPRLQSLLDALRSPTVGEHRLALELGKSNIQEQERTLMYRPLREIPRAKRTSVGKRILNTGMRLLKFILSPGCVLLFLALLLSHHNPPEELHGSQHSQTGTASSSHFKLPPRSMIDLLEKTEKHTHAPASGESNLPHLSGPFIGRDSDVHQITSMLIHSQQVGIVGIYGPPAVGKSTLAIHVGYKTVKHGITVRYINLNDVHLFRTQPDSYTSHYHTSNSQQAGTEVSTYPEGTALTVKWFSPTKHMYVTQTSQELVEWAKGITNDTLLIFDNCDNLLEENESLKDKFQRVILALRQSSGFLKIVITSRVQLAFIADFKAYKLKELDLASAIRLLQADSSLLNANDSQVIAELVGNNPLALRITANLVNEFRRPTKVINELKQNPVEALSPESLPQSQQIFHVIDISYKYLNMGSQRCGHYLSFFSGSFSESAGLHILELCNFNQPYKCLQKLVTRSLLESYALPYVSQHRLQFHRLIKEFFKYQQTQGELSGYRANATLFNSAFQIHYSQELSSYAARHQLDSIEGECLSGIEYDSHSFVELWKQIAEKPMLPPEALADLAHIFIESSMLTNIFTSAELLQPMQRILIEVSENLDAISEEIGTQNTLALYTSLLSKVKQCMVVGKVSYNVCHQLCTETGKVIFNVLVANANNISVLQHCMYHLSVSDLLSHFTIFCDFECKESRLISSLFLLIKVVLNFEVGRRDNIIVEILRVMDMSTIVALWLSSGVIGIGSVTKMLLFSCSIVHIVMFLLVKFGFDNLVANHFDIGIVNLVFYVVAYVSGIATLALLLAVTRIYVWIDSVTEILQLFLNSCSILHVVIIILLLLVGCGFKKTTIVLKRLLFYVISFVVVGSYLPWSVSALSTILYYLYSL